MPHTLRAMELGVVSEWRATLIRRETACLERDQCIAIDAELCADPARLEGLGDKQAGGRGPQAGLPARPALGRRPRQVRGERAPRHDPTRTRHDVLPHGAAPRRTGRGDVRRVDPRRGQRPRCRRPAWQGTDDGRHAGRARHRPGGGARRARLHRPGHDRHGAVRGRGEPAHLEDYGPIPAGVARHLATMDSRARTWLRRLYTSPTTGQLVAMDAATYRFPRRLARLIRLRDQLCRTPWCGAPIRHLDHPEPHAVGGETSEPNSQGLCEACNHHKQAAGWRALPRPGPGHVVETTTPTGHTYRSHAPPLVSPAWVITRPGVWSRTA